MHISTPGAGLPGLYKSDDAILEGYVDEDQRRDNAIVELRNSIAAHMESLAAVKAALDEFEALGGSIPRNAASEAIEFAEAEIGGVLEALDEGGVEWD